MSDRLHDHLSLGFRRGCVACAQAEADLALSRRALHREHRERGAEPDSAPPPVTMIGRRSR